MKKLIALLIVVLISALILSGCKAPEQVEKVAEPEVSEESEIDSGLDEIEDFDSLGTDLDEDLGLDELLDYE